MKKARGPKFYADMLMGKEPNNTGCSFAACNFRREKPFLKGTTGREAGPTCGLGGFFFFLFLFHQVPSIGPLPLPGGLAWNLPKQLGS